jgi:NADH dehydrogenase
VVSRPDFPSVEAGFVGYHAAQTLSRLACGRADLVVVNPTEHFLYLPLLPEFAVGLLEPGRVTVSVRQTRPGVRARSSVKWTGLT